LVREQDALHWSVVLVRVARRSWGLSPAVNTYQAPPSQERGDPPNRAAEQRGKREAKRVLETLTSFLIAGCGAGRALHQTPIEGRPA